MVGPSQSSSGQSILVVEYEEAVRRLVGLILKRAGYEVEAACNGREGLERYRSRSFDLVITDLDMPEMGGIEMIRCLSVADAHIRFLMMTGTPGAVPPGWPCLAKPFRTRDLLEKVATILRAENSR